MTIDERIEALTMNLELLSRDMETLRASVSELRVAAQQDGENIRGLARIAELHHERLIRLEGK